VIHLRAVMLIIPIIHSRRLFGDLAAQSARVGQVVLLCCCARVAIAQDDSTTFNRSRYASLPDEQVVQLEEFFNAYKKLKVFYQNATISVRGTEFRVPPPKDDLPIPNPSTELVVTGVMECKYRSRDAKYGSSGKCVLRLRCARQDGFSEA